MTPKTPAETAPDPAACATPAASSARASPGARFILVSPAHAGNVGAAARAIKVMGWRDLVLVAPHDPAIARRPEAVARASSAADVLAGARVVPTLADALDGVTWVCATAMTPRDFGPPTQEPRRHFQTLAGSGHRPAFVFGPERTGMTNDDVYRCHVCLSIPTDPEYGSLNLGQAVQIIAYEWRQAVGGFSVVETRAAAEAAAGRADAAAVAGALAHWQQVLVDIGFLDPGAPKKLMPRLQQLLNRAELREEEVHILRGIARAVDKHAGPGRR